MKTKITHHLDLIDGKLHIVFDEESLNFTPLCVDFTSGSTGYRVKHPSYELLYSAIGKVKGLKVLDATAGWGTDSFILANLGCDVTALEKNEVVYKLLSDGLRRANDVASKIFLINKDFFEYAADCSENFDIVYLDPMFPDDSKDALPKKEIQVLQMLVGDASQDALKYLEEAFKLKPKRVVLKRPLKAPEVLKPQFSVKGSSVRYDVYSQF